MSCCPVLVGRHVDVMLLKLSDFGCFGSILGPNYLFWRYFGCFG